METDEQHIRIMAILEVVGKPKDFVEQKLKDYIQKIKEDESLMVLSENISPAEQKEDIWTTFAEIEIVIKGLANLVGFCIDYMPSSVDIIKPEKFSFDQRVFNNFMNDTLAKLHRVDMIAKKASTDNNILKKNVANLIKNNCIILIRFGVKDLAGLSSFTGIREEELKKFLEALKKEGKIKEENSTYSLQNG